MREDSKSQVSDMNKTFHFISAFLILMGSIYLFAEVDGQEAADPIEEGSITNVTAYPAPGSVFEDLKQEIVFEFLGDLDSSTLYLSVSIDGGDLLGNVYFKDNRTLSYIPDWGYSYLNEVNIFILGGENGLKWKNGTQALEENISINYTMKAPEQYIAPLSYEGMTSNIGYLTLIDEDGQYLETFKSGSNGIVPLPEDYAGGFAVFHNGASKIEVRLERYFGPVFIAYSYVSFIDYNPFLYFGLWDSTTNNITFEFSHLMDRSSVEEMFDTRSLDGEFTWDGRSLTFHVTNRDPTRDYNVTIRSGAKSLWGEETQEDIWIKLYSTEEEDGAPVYILVFCIVILIVILGAGFVYGKGYYSGPNDRYFR